MILVENNSLKNKVLDELKKHNNYPMLEKIDFYKKEDAIGLVYYINVKLKDQFVFDNDNYDYSNNVKFVFCYLLPIVE